jgi:2-polyprenyl-6-methoxyphenol hydroxylase-like FAD-dependent oxidoreductase
VNPRITRKHYDVVIAGARCAGASTAMLLARRGFSVLLVDPLARGSDTLSTHALMRGAVLQLARWGLLDEIRSRGTPAIPTTTFHYGREEVRIPIKPGDGVDALYAPRRTVLDSVLVGGALDAGAEVVHGVALSDLLLDGTGRVRGARLADADRAVIEVTADLVIGADGVRSKVARLVKADTTTTASHAAASIYGYWKGLPADGNHWYYDTDVSVGTIPTNDDATCVFALVPRQRFDARGSAGLASLHTEALETVSPQLASTVADAEQAEKLRAFPGLPGFFRRSAGAGWALVGDAGYFKDPITAHGITDALRDAELLARAFSQGGDEALQSYEATRNGLAEGLLEITDRIASFEWDLDEVKELHLRLSDEMKAEVQHVLALDALD